MNEFHPTIVKLIDALKPFGTELFYATYKEGIFTFSNDNYGSIVDISDLNLKTVEYFVDGNYKAIYSEPDSDFKYILRLNYPIPNPVTFKPLWHFDIDRNMLDNVHIREHHRDIGYYNWGNIVVIDGQHNGNGRHYWAKMDAITREILEDGNHENI